MSCRADFSFHGYMEVCQFVYCLLSRSCKIGSLPSLNSWEEYIDPRKLVDFECVDAVDFLRSHDFGAVLRHHKSGEGRIFQDQCLKFIDRFVGVIVVQQPVTGDFPKGIYSFCPELLLEGDDHHMLSLFRKLIRVSERSGIVSSLESKSAVEEYASVVVDARAGHVGFGCCTEAINDVRQYSLSDLSFLACKSLCRVFKLCCLLVLKPPVDFPAVDIDLSECDVPERVVATCIQGVQSCVMSSEFELWSFFTKFTINEVRKSIATASSFMSSIHGIVYAVEIKLPLVDVIKIPSINKSIVRVVALSSPLVREDLIVVLELLVMKSVPLSPKVWPNQLFLPHLTPLLVLLVLFVLARQKYIGV